MEGPRPPEPHELSIIVQFLNKQLRPTFNWSIAKEYPTALNSSNLHNMRIILDNDKIVSHAVLKPLIVKTPLMILKIGAIGSVVTDAQHRNQGLSRSILEDCLMEVKKQNCDLAILWTNLYEFYRKLNFELAGYEHSFKLMASTEYFGDDLDKSKWKKMKLLTGAQISAEDFMKVYTHHTVMTVRTAEEVKKFLKIPDSRVYTVWSESGPLVAYAIEGKGADLQNYIHEWGGSVPAILFLLNSLLGQKKEGESVTLLVPNHSTQLLSYFLRKDDVLHNEGFLGMIKIVHPESLFYKIHKAAQSIGIGNLILTQTSAGTFRFGFGDEEINISDEKILVRYLFGPLPDPLPFQEQTVKSIHRIFPLPLWLWGWDSI